MTDYWDNLMETDEGAANYMQAYGEGPGCETRLIIGSFIDSGNSVLDVGCGPGWNLDHLLEYGPEKFLYKGTDLSPRFVRVSNKRRKELGVPGSVALPFELGDCRKIEEPDESWDVVLLQDVLEHTNGYEKPVSEALRVARKRIIISFWHLQDDDNPHINDDTDKGENGYGAWYDKRAWEKYLDTVGYTWLQTESPEDANRQHLFYFIDKEEPK